MTMDETTALEDYFRVCTLLREDLDQVISDLDFKRQPDHKIYYAVDFSELYEYILPSEAYLDFILFPEAYGDGEEEKIGAQAIQQLILVVHMAVKCIRRNTKHLCDGPHRQPSSARRHRRRPCRPCLRLPSPPGPNP